MSLGGRFCSAPSPSAGECVLDFPHPGEDHRAANGTRWQRTRHGDAGEIIDMALGFAGATLTDRVAMSLMVAFGRAEPDDEISRYPASFVATFADMARAVIAQFEVHDIDQPTVTWVDGCGQCDTPERDHGHVSHTWVEPTDEQRDERQQLRRLNNARMVARG